MTFLKEAQIGRAKSHFRSSTHSFDGRKFERWLLKVVLGMWGLGNLGGDGAALDRNPPEQLKLMMLGRELFPETWGLYMPGPIGPHYLNYGEVSVQPFTHPREDRVFAAQIGLGRVRFNLLLGTPDTPAIAGVRRPKSLSFHYPNPDFIFQTV
jgi:hypothetical protein